MGISGQVHLWTKKWSVWEGEGVGERVQGKKEDKMGISMKSQHDHNPVVRQTRNPGVAPKVEEARPGIKLGDGKCMQAKAPSIWEGRSFREGQGMDASDSEIMPWLLDVCVIPSVTQCIPLIPCFHAFNNYLLNAGFQAPT